MSLYNFVLRHTDGELVTIKAETEEAARRAAMLKRWGPFPSPDIPHAPHYKGLGLTILSKQGV